MINFFPLIKTFQHFNLLDCLSDKQLDYHLIISDRITHMEINMPNALLKRKT